jgi:hypothetical protein
VNPFTGKPLSAEAKKDRLYIAVSGRNGIGPPEAFRFKLDEEKDYYVHTDIFDPHNWERVKP